MARRTVTLGDLKTRYPGISLTLRLPNPDTGGTRSVAFRPTHRVESRLPDHRIIVDYVRLLVPGRTEDLQSSGLDQEFWAAPTPADYRVLAHGYSTVERSTFGHSPKDKSWWAVICSEPAWTKAVITATEIDFEPVEETSDYTGSSPVVLRGNGVYFAQAASGGPIKIGWSSDARRRRAELQTAQAEVLSYLAFIPGSVEDEKALHSRFHRWRLEGEWFEEGPVLTWLRSRGYVRQGAISQS